MAENNTALPSEEQQQNDFATTLLGAVSENEQRVANTKANLVAIEVGTSKTIPGGGTVLGTFGDTSFSDRNGQRTISFKAKQKTVPAAVSNEAAINPVAVADELATGIPSFNVAQEFAKVKAFTDMKDKEDAAQQLFVNLATQASRIQSELTKQARQRAGVNDAESALNNYIAIENAMKAAGRIPAYASTIQVRQARETYQKTLVIANAEESDMLKNHPQLNEFKRYEALLTREFGQIDRSQQRQEALESALPFAMTNKNLLNINYALGLNLDKPEEIKTRAAKFLKSDKALLKVVEADKNTIPALLADADPKVRQYAYNILRENELRLNNGELPDYVKILEPIVRDRESLMKPDNKKALAKPTSDFSRAVGNAAKEEAKGRAILNDLLFQIEETTKRKYRDMGVWTYNDPQIKAVVDSVKVNTKNGQVLLSDGIDAVMSTDIKMPDGSPMRPEEKIKRMTESLTISMKNDKKSILLPSAENYGGPLSAQLRNIAMRSYMRAQTKKNQGLDPTVIQFLRTGEE